VPSMVIRHTIHHKVDRSNNKYYVVLTKFSLSGRRQRSTYLILDVLLKTAQRYQSREEDLFFVAIGDLICFLCIDGPYYVPTNLS
jgi:hypothetical protein